MSGAQKKSTFEDNFYNLPLFSPPLFPWPIDARDASFAVTLPISVGTYKWNRRYARTFPLSCSFSFRRAKNGPSG